MKVKQFLKRLGRFWGCVFTGCMVLILCVNLYTIIARNVFKVTQPTVFGFSNAVVITGSMSGSIEVDDMVIIHEQAAYEKGDIITFHSGSSLVTHRIVEVTEDGYLTKGDANNAVDEETVDISAVVGKVVLVIPKVGIAIRFLLSPPGMAIMVLSLVLIIEFPYMAESFRQRKDKKQ